MDGMTSADVFCWCQVPVFAVHPGTAEKMRPLVQGRDVVFRENIFVPEGCLFPLNPAGVDLAKRFQRTKEAGSGS